MRIAILDDYQNRALDLADWSAVAAQCAIQVFDRAFPSIDAAVECLQPFDILCTMRERMALPRELLERLPRLKLITFTGAQHRTLDLAAATDLGIVVCGTTRRGNGHHATPELAWGLILSLARHLPFEANNMRHSGWQRTLGQVLSGKTLGLIGVGRLGSRMVPIGRAFGMEIIAWSQNLTDEAAAAVGVKRVDKQELFKRSDIVSLHLVLSDRSRGVVGRPEFALMKPTALLVNTARAGLVDSEALHAALIGKQIAGAGLDVFDREPLPDDDPIRQWPNVILTPHLGYTVEELFRVFYEDTADNVLAFLAGNPIRVVNPAALEGARVARI
ncbi:D-2-hydroxyacid dehydrogenase family protein [Microvirga antarctica]|uniref:D-2-hydroxyacid dehydrogenase family protein n=1 Tax=Microvirga antarctica TaxID=2819233 RepID=UPI001B30CB1B|nr:D-2-hydroxyacid dehydrogenase family protein [Microvirga antarctica]